jgi:cytochrome c oxidase subunit 2
MQLTVLALSLVLMAIIVWAFIGAARAAGSGKVPTNIESRRNWIIVSLTVIGVVVTVISLRPWPLAVAKTATVVNASAAQWHWELDTDKVPLGKPVAFKVRTADVNHGFGVMDASGKLLFQVQAMPGYVNQVEYVFDTPGTYHVVCLEYCGVAHHTMTAEFTVVAE